MRLQDLTFVQRIGKGSFAEVFKVLRKCDQQFYALKVMPFTTKEKLPALLNEIRLLASFQNHPYVLNYRDSCISKGKLYLLTDYADQGDLQHYIANNAPLSDGHLLQLSLQIAKGLQALHSQKIAHRDLKPANILLQQGACKISDFNISKLMKHALMQTRTGTPYFSAPEVWSGKSYTLACDIWSYGCLIYNMASKAYPFEASNMAQLQKLVSRGKFDPLNNRSEQLEMLVKMTLRVNPRDRPSSADLVSFLQMREAPFTSTPLKMLSTISYKQPCFLINERLPKSNFEDKKQAILKSVNSGSIRPRVFSHCQAFKLQSQLLQKAQAKAFDLIEQCQKYQPSHADGGEYFCTPKKTQRGEDDQRDIRTTPKMQRPASLSSRSRSGSHRKLSQISRSRLQSRQHGMAQHRKR